MKTSKLDRLEKILGGTSISALSTPFIGKTEDLEGVRGVYVLSFAGGKYLYVGKSTNLRSRLQWHLDRNAGRVSTLGGVSDKYHSVTDKHPLTGIFVVEHGTLRLETLTSRESLWIGIVHKLIGGSRLVNVNYSGTPGRKKKMQLSPEERAARAARMSHTIRSLHKDPVYKAKMKQIAKENYSKVDPSIRAASKARTSAALKAKFSDPKRREFMASKVKQQWQDPEFRRINSERIKRVLEKHRNGEKPIRRKVHLMEVTLLLQPKNSPLQRRYLVRPTFVLPLLSLPSTSDKGPEKKLPGLLQNAISIVRKDPVDWETGKDLLVRSKADEVALADHPFIRYAQAYRRKTGSYRTQPCLVRRKDGHLRRLFSHRKVELASAGLQHVKDYQNLWAFWSDQHKHPLMR